MDRSAKTDDVMFTWRVENFSACPLKKNVPLQSPSFHMGSLDRTEWHLCLYPKGKSDDHLTCDLYRENDKGPGSVNVNCQFSLVIAEGVPEREFKSASQAYSRQVSSSHKLMKLENLFEKKHSLLPKDTLTIRCHLWEAKPEVSEVKATVAVKALVDCMYDGKLDAPSCDIPEELYAMSCQEIVDIKRKLFPYIHEYSARTRFGVEKRRFIWPIRNVSSIKREQKLSVPLTCSSARAPPFTLTISFKGEAETAQVDIRKLSNKDIGPIYVVCRMVVLDINDRDHISSEKEKYFDSPSQDEVWSFPSFFTRKNLIDSKCLCLPNDALHLLCSFTVSVGAEPSMIEEYKFVSLTTETYTDTNDMGTMAEDLKSFYKDKRLFDVALCVKNQTFPAHKAVLGSRSPVFSAMFEHDTVEKNSHIVNIQDVDAKTLDLMLSFMYTDSIEDLKSESAIKLYSASDKYQVISLKKKCSSFLKSNITVDNVYKILVLADMHQDKELKMAAQDFLFEPPYDAFLSNEFERLIDCSSPLARATLSGWIRKLKSDMALNV